MKYDEKRNVTHTHTHAHRFVNNLITFEQREAKEIYSERLKLLIRAGHVYVNIFQIN